MTPTFFDRLDWRDDRVFFDDLVFRLQPAPASEWELGDRCFLLYKKKSLVDQYQRYWSTRDFQPKSILELGIFEGGSIAFWNLCFQPAKHVGIDINTRDNAEYFDEFVASRGASEDIVTYRGVDQADASALRAIVKREFATPLDLVIDDASHLYTPTRTSFETLFPFLRPGGLYVIEDWAWAHWRVFQDPDHSWAREVSLTRLIWEMIEAIGSSWGLIADLVLFPGLAVVERGPTELGDDFDLEQHIVRRPRPRSLARRAVRSARYRARRLLRP